METSQDTVAMTIRTHFDEILQMWTVEVERAASARGLSRPETVNVMPVYLRSLADATDGPLGSPSSQRTVLIEAHLTTRLRQGFDLHEIVAEFALLGHCVSQIWARLSPEHRPDPIEAESFYAELHVAAALAAEVFQKHMQEDAQSERRFARRLERAASESLRGEAPLARADYDDVLSVICEATEAFAAALVLQDEAGAPAVVTGITCPAPTAGAFEAFVSFLDLFVDTEHSVHEAIHSRDLPATGVLADSELGRVLVTRFVVEDHRAAIVIAIAEPRSFSTREVRRLESLAERLALHLESAGLYGRLRSTIAALRAEKFVRETFVSVLAHDLRGPLGAARGQAHLLGLRTDASTSERNAAERIDRILVRMDRMVRDLLDANRIQGGELLRLHIAECDLREVVSEIIDELATVYPGRVHLAPGGPVRGYFGCEEIHRAVANLATNAVKYGAMGSPVHVSVHAGPGAIATVSVHNEGKPIPRDQQASIFDVFRRGTSATESGELGWGLGLTLVRGAAEAHGGGVSIQSDAAHGTTFTIALPLDARPFQRPSLIPADTAADAPSSHAAHAAHVG